ncbi:MAG: M1 family aminopeptidase [Colwellia sp.]
MKLLWGIKLILISLLFINVSYAKPVINNYNIEAKLHQHDGIIQVKATLTITDSTQSSIEFLLNKNAKIDSVTLNAQPIAYEFDTSGNSPNIYIEHGKLLKLKSRLLQNQQNKLRFSYSLKVNDVNYLSSLVDGTALEMGLYSAWFPLNENYGKFNFFLKLHLPDTYKVTGNAEVTKRNDGWVLKSNNPSFDIVVIASEKSTLHELQLGEAKVSVFNMDSESNNIDNLLIDIQKLLLFFESKVGLPNANIKNIKFVLLPRSSGPSYSRSGFAAITKSPKEKYDRMLRTVAHEVGHFWWNKAPTQTWEDWLNESFSEYFSYLALEHIYGKNKKSELIEHYRPKIKKLPPIVGLSRSDKHAYTVLYIKGALILDELNLKIGDKNFFKLLQQTNNKNIKDTETFISLLKELYGSDVSMWFYKKLT